MFLMVIFITVNIDLLLIKKKNNQVVLLFRMKKNISLQRFSQDSSPINNYGYKLLDFCKKNEHLYWK